MIMSRTLQKVVVASLIALCVVLALLFLLWLSPWLAIKGILEAAYADLLAASVPWRLAVALLALAAPPFVLALIRLTSAKAPFLDEKWPPKKLHAALIVCAYIGVFSISMYFLTRNQVFGAGAARWVCTKEYEFYERAGVCPYHGRRLLAVTPELIETIRYVEKHGPPKPILLGPEGPFRNSANGDPLVWFGVSLDGRLRPYSGPGFDEISGEPLRAADAALIAQFQSDAAQEADVRARAEQEEDARQRARQAERDRAESLAREIQSVQQMLGASPQDAALHYRLGQLLVRQGRTTDAARAFKQALWYDPNHAQAREALSRIGG